MNVAFLCLGGNMGNRLANLSHAKELMCEERLQITDQSNIYETSAWGNENSPDYYNQCVRIETDLDPHSLMRLLLDIEKRLGRMRTENRNESRTVDIDILLYEHETINSENLIVPHPRMHLRQFVLKPLNEIASHVVHPVLNVTVEYLLKTCTDTLTVKEVEQNVHLH